VLAERYVRAGTDVDPLARNVSVPVCAKGNEFYRKGPLGDSIIKGFT
jgi:hypothetical protein